MKGEAELRLDRLWQAMTIGVVKLNVDGLEPLEHGKTDTSRRKPIRPPCLLVR